MVNCDWSNIYPSLTLFSFLSKNMSTVYRRGGNHFNCFAISLRIGAKREGGGGGIKEKVKTRSAPYNLRFRTISLNKNILILTKN